MGYYGKLEEKKKAQELRRKGFSYREILTHVDVSKDTSSRWCRDIELTAEHEKRLLSRKILGQRAGSLQAAKNKRQRRIETINQINKIASEQIAKLTKRDKFIAGISLYA